MGSPFFMRLRERLRQFGLAGLFSITLQLVTRWNDATLQLRAMRDERDQWQERFDRERLLWEQRLDQERDRHAATIASLTAEHSKLLAFFSGMQQQESLENSPQMEDALQAVADKFLRDPLSATIEEAKAEDAANYRARQEQLAQELAILEQAALPPM